MKVRKLTYSLRVQRISSPNDWARSSRADWWVKWRWISWQNCGDSTQWGRTSALIGPKLSEPAGFTIYGVRALQHGFPFISAKLDIFIRAIVHRRVAAYYRERVNRNSEFVISEFYSTRMRVLIAWLLAVIAAKMVGSSSSVAFWPTKSSAVITPFSMNSSALPKEWGVWWKLAFRVRLE